MAAYRFLRRWWLRWQIHELAMYLRACERDGLVDSLSLREFRGQIAEMETELITLTPAPSATTWRT